MTSPSSTPSPHDPDRREREPRPRYEQASWWSMHTTASLLLNFHTLLASVRLLRMEIASGDLSRERVDLRARQVQAEVDDITAIVAELRRRGHSVDWEE